MEWRPSASLGALKVRAEMIRRVRQFFYDREVLEVEVPHLDFFANTDPNMESIAVSCDGRQNYLQTSPEYCMKRLLARDAMSIFSFAKAFRDGEISPRHNPEFTMLEWYRVGQDWQQLMAEVASVVNHAVAVCRALPPAVFVSYGAVFEEYLGINPHIISDSDLFTMTTARVDVGAMQLSRVECLDLLFSYFIEPHLGHDGVHFVYDYPACMSALAQVEENAEGVTVARRFEAFIVGRELANGYQELTDADEQARRFAADEAQRHQQGKQLYRGDPRLVAALQQGLPQCSGVALGFDRLVMAALQVDDIQQVLAFPYRPL